MPLKEIINLSFHELNSPLTILIFTAKILIFFTYLFFLLKLFDFFNHKGKGFIGFVVVVITLLLTLSISLSITGNNFSINFVIP